MSDQVKTALIELEKSDPNLHIILEFLVKAHVKTHKNQADMTMTELYLTFKRKYCKKFGSFTVVLMQVGDFFELYEIENDMSDCNSIGRVADVMVRPGTWRTEIRTPSPRRDWERSPW